MGHSSEFNYWLKALGSDAEIVTLQISGITPISYGYNGAPKNEWGKKVIADINTAMEEIVKDTSITLGINKWITPKEQMMVYKVTQKLWGEYLKK